MSVLREYMVPEIRLSVLCKTNVLSLLHASPSSQIYALELGPCWLEFRLSSRLNASAIPQLLCRLALLRTCRGGCRRVDPAQQSLFKPLPWARPLVLSCVHTLSFSMLGLRYHGNRPGRQFCPVPCHNTSRICVRQPHG